jgi:hypothetical protein
VILLDKSCKWGVWSYSVQRWVSVQAYMLFFTHN